MHPAPVAATTDPLQLKKLPSCTNSHRSADASPGSPLLPTTTAAPCGNPIAARQPVRRTTYSMNGDQYPLAYGLGVTIPLVAIPAGPLSIGAVDLLLPAAILVIATRQARPRVTVQLYSVFLTLLMLSSIGLGVEGVLRSLRVAAIFTPYLLWSSCRFSPGQARELLKVWVVAGGLAVGLGPLFLLVGVTNFGVTQELFLGGGFGATPRASGLVGNTTPYGHLVASWVTGAVLTARHLWTRWPLVVAVTTGIGGIALLTASSRGAFVHLLVSGLLMSLLFRRPSPKAWVTTGSKGAVAAASVVAVLVVGLPLLPQPSRFLTATLDRLNPSADLFASNARVVSWPLTLTKLPEVPFLGWGVADEITVEGHLVDNSFLAAGLLAGLVGGLAFAGFWLRLAFQGWAFRFDSTPRSVLFAITGGQIVHLMFGEMFTQWYSMAFVMFLLGALHFWPD